MLDAFLNQLQLETKEENKMYAQSPYTLINEFVQRSFCETKIPRSVIPQ